MAADGQPNQFDPRMQVAFEEAMGVRESSWKSVRPGKIKWNEADVARVARDMLDCIPVRAANMIRAGTYAGGALLKVDSDVSRPSFREIALNYVWIKPVLRSYPKHVPGGMFLTDCFLYLDDLFGGTLFSGPKLINAAEEAGRLKKLIGSLRYLYRNSVKSHNARVTELKGMLEPSPRSDAVRQQQLARAERLEGDRMVEALRDGGDGADEAHGALDGRDDDGRAEPAHDDDDTDDASDPGADSGDETTSEAEEEPSEDENVGGEANAHGDRRVRSEESKGEGMENGLDDGEDSGEDSDATLPLPGGGPTDRPCLSPYPFDDSDAYSPTVEPGSPWEDAKPAGGPVDSDDEGPPNVPCSWRGTAAEDLVNSVPPLPDSDDESEIDYVTPAKRVAPDDQVDESSMKVSKKAKVDAFHEAMGMVEVKDPKDVKPSAHSIKMPPLNQPRWFKDAVAELKSSCPPAVGPQANPAKKPKKNGTKNEKTLAKKKASFHRGNPRPSSGPPRADVAIAEGDSPSSASAAGMYGEYSLEGIPRNALPDPNRKHQGKHSYTIQKGDAKLEVLLKSRAYYVRTGQKGQVSWAKHGGPRDAWIVACGRAGVLP